MTRERLKKYLPLLKFLQKSKNATGLIKSADREIIDVICECAHNLINNNLKLTTNQKKKLKHHKKALLLLDNKKTSITKKKKALQKGNGLITALLSVAIPAIIGAIAGA